MNKFNVKIQTARTSFTTIYEVTGPKSDCEAWLENLKGSFHPAGYGTHGKIIETLSNGDVVMSAYRSNSCD